MLLSYLLYLLSLYNFLPTLLDRFTRRILPIAIAGLNRRDVEISSRFVDGLSSSKEKEMVEVEIALEINLTIEDRQPEEKSVLSWHVDKIDEHSSTTALTK
ncbi:hypothetical protein AVEN_242423-1 [Araneus ventricosus]|uniref:Uncharacterized protein n=1 Tax=Araneus ventricosus TaxID=182803 RepID=A0A4Y2V4K7_ARAVE|nr:hypothetical protein AVEN_242423-1 [Araneus ventricosus]